MSEKRNEIMEEQRRAREEFLRLKKMQQGELEPEAKPSEVAVAPKTFGEKSSNFWYHYKIHTVVITFFVIVLAIIVTQCATREKYDFEVMYFAYTPALDVEMTKIEEYFEKYAEDINGDGEVNINVKNCSVSDSNKDISRTTILSKVQSILVAEKSVVVYIVDDKAIKYFENAFDISIFAEGPYPLGKDFYDATATELIELPEGLSIGLRVTEGTTFQGDEEAEVAFIQGKKVIEKLKKQNG